MNVTRIAGRKVVDAKSSVTIMVTEEDINGATTKAPDSCAMARACNRALGKEARIHISRVYISENGGTWLRYRVSNDLRSEIISFDRGGAFLPGVYTLWAIDTLKNTGIRGPRKTPKEKHRAPIQIRDIRTGPANGV